MAESVESRNTPRTFGFGKLTIIYVNIFDEITSTVKSEERLGGRLKKNFRACILPVVGNINPISQFRR